MDYLGTPDVARIVDSSLAVVTELINMHNNTTRETGSRVSWTN